MLKNHNFIFLIILFSVAIVASALFTTKDGYAQTTANQTVAITTNIDPITILTNELMPLLDTSAIGNLTSLTVTTNLPCDTSNVPKVKIIAGILGNTTNVIDSSSDYTNNKGPRDTCVFTDKITNVTAKGIPAMNRVFLKNTGSTPIHIPEGVMVTLTGIFGKPPPKSTAFVFQDDFSTDKTWVTSDATNIRRVAGNANLEFDSTATIDARMVKDLQATDASGVGNNASNTNWVLRFKLAPDTVTQSTVEAIRLFVGLCSADSNPHTSMDYVGLQALISASLKTYNLSDTDGTSPVTTDTDQTFTRLITVETVYVEIKRLSATSYSIEFFSDANYTTSLESKTGTLVSTTDTLRYLCVGMRSDGAGMNHVLNGIIDDVKFYNNVSSV